ncbi:Isoleucine--tRNA ligase, chloroplastic/mitochondrial [Asimina triloba]
MARPVVSGQAGLARCIGCSLLHGRARLRMQAPILSHRYCWSIGKTGALSTFGFKSSLNRDSPFPNTKPYCTLPTEDLGYFSKRRARGPVMAAKKASEGAKQDSGKYKDTIDLPKTAFSMRANSVVREPEIQKLWEENQVFKRVADKNNGGSFTLHDGPPYANGDLHIGHALNKILKDIVNRYKIVLKEQGQPYLHIVLWIAEERRACLTVKALAISSRGAMSQLTTPFSAKKSRLHPSMDQDARRTLTPIKLRKKAAKFAKDTVQNQMKSFKRYGVWGDWNNPYLTLSPEYEAAQIEVFGQMAINGHIYRGRKPVHWSPSSRTALAEAELETKGICIVDFAQFLMIVYVRHILAISMQYPEGHVSKSIYAIFKLVGAPPSSDGLLEEFFPDLCLAIWTTTPWTIPANAGRHLTPVKNLEMHVLDAQVVAHAPLNFVVLFSSAVAVNAKLLYSVTEVYLEDMSQSPGTRKLSNVLKSEQRKPFVIVASELIPTLQSKWGVKLSVKKTFQGSALENYRYIHPIDNRECLVVIGGEYITTESGTGLVHTAPGHGQEDYLTGLKYGLPIISPVDDDGKFTEEADPFGGLDVLGDGNIAVVKYLDQKMSLVMEEPYKHKYPYDWRTKKPTIFRATEQWFASVEGFRDAAMDAISQVTWVPAQGTRVQPPDQLNQFNLPGKENLSHDPHFNSVTFLFLATKVTASNDREMAPTFSQIVFSVTFPPSAPCF